MFILYFIKVISGDLLCVCGLIDQLSLVGCCHSDEMEDGDSHLFFGGSVPGDGSSSLQIPGAALREVGRLSRYQYIFLFSLPAVNCSLLESISSFTVNCRLNLC